MKIHTIKKDIKDIWNKYVLSKKDGSIFHMFEWSYIIKAVYGHKPLFLVAVNQDNVVGILPLILIKVPIIGSKFVSIPFFDYAGILSDSPEVTTCLLNKAIRIAYKFKSKSIEIRQAYPLPLDTDNCFSKYTRKVRMVKSLINTSPESLMLSFKSKLRSQIKRPLKEGIYVKIGGMELLKDFYKVFSTNMKDLGSPVHSYKLMYMIFKYFSTYSRIFVAYYKKIPISCAFTLGLKDTLENPWASSLKRYNKFSPNMFLYWKMLEYACKKGFSYFSFGRSSYGSGTYRFKKQWGTEEIPLYWYKYSYYPSDEDKNIIDVKEKYKMFVKLWKKMPIFFANFFGPFIRKYIDL